MTTLARRRFSHDDQLRFASVSGDHNPMHIDALQARRTQAGAPVVHGIHLLLWALDSLASSSPNLPPLRSLRAHFQKFIFLDEFVEVVLAERSPNGVRLNISVDGSTRSKYNLVFGDAVDERPPLSDSVMQSLPLSNVASDLSFEEMVALAGCFPFSMTPEDAQRLFPAVTRWIGARRVAALAASTYLVGMVCPGLHSIYSQLSIRTCAESNPQDFLSFRVTDADSRFRSIEQEIAGGGLTGTVHSTARIPPVTQSSMESLAGLVSPSEFSGSVALIVGGSRGLGELTAKLIAAGGGHVMVTWKHGKEDAEKVAREIRAAGGTCDTLQYDAGQPVAAQLASLPSPPTHAYYFATPSIFRPQSEIFSIDRFKEFLAIYVHGFWQLLQVLRSLQPKLSLFYPSSIAVSERPQGMTEYTMAKAAGEILCADINAEMASVHVTISRLPRLLTDQTATVAAMETLDPVDVMLPIIREVQSLRP